jgi:bifunctional non-homologous end joining protein LigD
MLPRIRPMRLRLVKEPFDHPDYIFELKHDGFRALAYIENAECRLISRNLNNLRFDSLGTALAKLPAKNAILDGEIVALDKQGVSQFNALLTARGRGTAVFYAFDLMWLNGADLRRTPLVARKARLSELLSKSGCSRLLDAQHIEREGRQLFAEICRRDLEGVVGKRRHGLYRDDRPDWVKVKNPTYTQAEGRHELLTRRKLPA